MDSTYDFEKIFIIAEAGVNHNGSIELAHQLIDAAVAAGADAVKFQTFKANNIATESAPKAGYQKQQTDTSESQFQMLKKLELDSETHRVLMDYCTQRGILFLSTPFDLESIDLLDELGLPFFKIPSGEITNLPHLRKIAQCNKPVIVSTGMATKEEIGQCLNVLFDAGLSQDMVSVLHCNTQYPTPMEDVNLLAMQDIANTFHDIRVGYSDHTLGIEVPIAAAALGAQIIEKHFTLDTTSEGPDHAASLEPQELAQMVSAIRNIERARGTMEKRPSQSEQGNRAIVRKSIVAAQAIEAGECFTESNVTTKRPGTGMSPMLWDNVIGQKAPRSFDADELIEL